MSPIAAVAVLPSYALRLARPWRSAAGGAARRRGWLVRVEDEAGRVGWGDSPAPLPDPGDDAPAGLLAALAAPLPGRTPQQALAGLAPSPAAFGLEVALLDLLARQRGLPLARLLAPDAAARVAVNAVVPFDGVAGAIADGFSVIKLKLGLAPWREEVAALRRLVLPDGVRLRLDANQAWSRDEAAAVIAALAGLPIDSLEEPLRDPDPAVLAGLQAAAHFSLALDESLEPGKLPDPVSVRRLVLKPARLGGLRATLALAREARRGGLEVVVTTLVESAVGVAATAALAAALDPLAHGLATASWLAEDVAAPLPIVGGFIDVTAHEGHGVRPGI
ncbi:MAG: hypothetical protein RLZZ501_1003 [Pseudomonadota bacterium]